MKVYIAGPYTVGDPCENVYNAVKAGNHFLDAGHEVFIPHLSHFHHTMTPRPYGDWIRNDLAFLPACDILYRLPGESPGSDGEVRRAQELDIPVFHTIKEALAYKS